MPSDESTGALDKAADLLSEILHTLVNVETQSKSSRSDSSGSSTRAVALDLPKAGENTNTPGLAPACLNDPHTQTVLELSHATQTTVGSEKDSVAAERAHLMGRPELLQAGQSCEGITAGLETPRIVVAPDLPQTDKNVAGCESDSGLETPEKKAAPKLPQASHSNTGCVNDIAGLENLQGAAAPELPQVCKSSAGFECQNDFVDKQIPSKAALELPQIGKSVAGYENDSVGLEASQTAAPELPQVTKRVLGGETDFVGLEMPHKAVPELSQGDQTIADYGNDFVDLDSSMLEAHDGEYLKEPQECQQFSKISSTRPTTATTMRPSTASTLAPSITAEPDRTGQNLELNLTSLEEYGGELDNTLQTNDDIALARALLREHDTRAQKIGAALHARIIEVEQCKSEIAKCNFELEQCKQELLQRDTERVDLKSQLVQACEQLRERDKELDDLKVCHQEKSEKLAQTCERLHERDQELRDLNVQFQDRDEKLIQAHALVQQHHTKLEESEVEIHNSKKLQHDLQQHAARVCQLDSMLIERDTEHSELKLHLNEQHAKLQQSNSEFAHCDAEMKLFKTELEQRSMHVNQLNWQLQEKDVSVSERDTECLELKTKLDQACEKLRENNKALTELQNCEVELLRREADLTERNAELRQSDILLQQNKMEYTELELQMNYTTNELRNRDETLSQCKAELLQRDANMNECSIQLHRSDSLLQQENLELAKLKTHLDQTSKELRNRDESLAQHGVELLQRDADLKQCNVHLQQRDNLLRQENLECTELKSQLQSASTELRSRDETLTQLRKNLRSIADELTGSPGQLVKDNGKTAGLKLMLDHVTGQSGKTENCFHLRNELQRISDELCNINLQPQQSIEYTELKLKLESVQMHLALQDNIQGCKKPFQSTADEPDCLQKAPRQSGTPSSQIGKEIAELRAQIHEHSLTSQQLKSAVEKEVTNYSEFIKHLADSSAGSILSQKLDLSSTEILDIGKYGYALICKENCSKNRVVVRVQSQRWVDVVVKEWAHGAEIGTHPHIVANNQVVMHRDVNKEMERCILTGFEEGTLKGRRPKCFPYCYFCIMCEYMDRGTVQDLIDRHLVTPENAAAITCQVAKALAFMHKKQRSHNDIKPENILLRQSSTSNSLVVKLADIGFSRPSTEHKHDCDLLSYTICCMGLGKRFDGCTEKDHQANAIAEFQAVVQSATNNHELWDRLVEVVQGLWQGSMSIAQVAEMKVLQGYSVQVPHLATAHLEAEAKATVKRRNMMALEKFNWKKHEIHADILDRTLTGGYPKQRERKDSSEILKR